MSIRIAQIVDAKEIQSVIVDSVRPHWCEDFNDQGWENFLAPNQLGSIPARLQDKAYLTVCYLAEGRIVGILGIYKLEKIDQLFVLPIARKMGVASALWSYAKEICIKQGNSKRFWVKSSTLAVPVYESFGFEKTGNRETENGISYYFVVSDNVYLTVQISSPPNSSLEKPGVVARPFHTII